MFSNINFKNKYLDCRKKLIRILGIIFTCSRKHSFYMFTRDRLLLLKHPIKKLRMRYKISVAKLASSTLFNRSFIDVTITTFTFAAQISNGHFPAKNVIYELIINQIHRISCWQSHRPSRLDRNACYSFTIHCENTAPCEIRQSISAYLPKAPMLCISSLPVLLISAPVAGCLSRMSMTR